MKKIDMPLLSITSENMRHLPSERVVTWDMGSELPVRAGGEFDLRAFYLNSDYDWIVGKDSRGIKILVALCRQEAIESGGTMGEVR